MKVSLIGLFVCLALTVAVRAEAQDVATAEALFKKGVDDMASDKYDTACPTILESLRLDPRPGTLFTLAECYNKAGKIASAVARYQEYLNQFSRMTPDQQSKQLGREKVSQEQRDKLKADVPLLTIKLAPGSPAGAVVQRDDVTLGAPTLGVALPVDPGPHTIVGQAPGGPATTETVTIQKGEKKELTLVVKPPEPGAEPSGPASSPKGGLASGGPPRDESRGSVQRIAGITIGSVGLAGLLVGAITGAVTLGTKGTITDHCDLETKECRDQEGLDAVSSAAATGMASTVTLVIGGALTGTGIIVFFTAPKPDSAPAVGLRAFPGGLGIAGSF